jgi:hypothetical protein
MTNMKTILVTSALLSSTILACTKREVPVTNHEGPRRSDEIIVAPASELVDLAAFRAIDTNSLNSKLATANTSDKLYTIQTLARFVLDRTYVEDERLSSSPKMREALKIFMRALIGDASTKGLIHTDPKAAAEWIENTRIIIESGCDGTGKGCSQAIFRFFKQDIGSSKVMEASAKATEFEIDNINFVQAESANKILETKMLKADLVRTYYRRLKMAYELKNQIMDRELEFLYLARASQYAEAFNLAKSTTRERELLAQHIEVFETILTGFNPDLSNPQFRNRFETFVNNFGPWRYSRRGDNPFGRSSTRMLALAAQNFLYNNDSLSPSLVDAIRDSQEIPKSPDSTTQVNYEQKLFESLDSSFSLIVKQIQERQPTIWTNLGLNDSFQRDEYFFIIDRIFGDHLTIEDASEVWRGTKRDSKTLLKVAEQYVKIQIAAQTVRTNKYMASIYSNREWSSSTLLEKAIEQSYPVQTQWNQLLGRIERIHLFLDRSLKSTEDIWGGSDFSKVDRMLSSVRRNIKYLSVYPNMMMMAYYMAESKFKLTIYTFFGKVDIDTGRIIGWFFDGKLMPFFNFGNDGNGLKRIETLYAFLFALKTDTFTSFSASRGEKIDVVRFFEAVITKFLDEERIELSGAIDEIRTETRRNSLETFLKTCAQDRDFINRGLKPGTAGAKLPIELWAFKYSTYVGTTASSGHGQAALRFHNDTRAEKIRTLNSSLRAKLDFVQIMTELLEEQLIKNGTSSAEIQKVKNQIELHTSKVRQLRAEFLTEVTRWNRTLSNCIDQSVKIEIDRQGELLEMEEKHLRYVWSKMKTARSASNKEAIFANLNKEIASSTGAVGISSSKPYLPKSHASEDNYVYADLDVTLRMVQHLKKIAPNVDIIMPSDLSDSSLWKEENRRVIPFSSSEEEFVRAGMKNFDEGTATIMSWLNETSDPTTFIQRLNVTTELYKLGSFQVFDITNPSCRDQGDITKCPIKNEEVTSDELVNQTSSIIRMLSMTDGGKPKKDTRIISLVGATSRWNRDKLKRGFVLEENGDPKTLFESLFEGLVQDTSLLDEAKDFNLTNRSIGEFLFAPEKEFRKIVSQGFQPSVDQYFGRANALIKSIEALEKKDGISGNIIDYSYEIRPSGMARVALDRRGQSPVYLARRKIEDFATTRLLFDRETGEAFKSPTQVERNQSP